MSTVTTPARTSTAVVVGGLAIWFAAALLLAVGGGFATGGPPLALATAAVTPPLVAIGLLTASAGFRSWVETLDLPFLTLMQMTRMVGFGFLAAWAVGGVPGGFALPAGLGDIAVAATAPLVALMLAGTPLAAWRRRWFYSWTAFGVGDLIVALALGALHSPSAIGVFAEAGRDTTALAELPLSLVPTFVVPVMLSLHVLSLYLVRTQRNDHGPPLCE